MSFATKRIGPPCCTLFTFIACYSLQFILSQNYLSPTISVLAEKTLLKTTCHFLLLLVGFDALTYQKDYDRSPILVGHYRPADQLNEREMSCLPYIWCVPLIISFCSSLGSTLLLIERTTIDPLYLWVIKTLFWRRCQGV